MLALADDPEPDHLEGLDGPRGERRRGISASGRHLRLGYESLDDRFLRIDGFVSKRFNVEANGRRDVIERFAVRVTLADDHTLEAQRIGHVSVGVTLDDDLELACHQDSPRSGSTLVALVAHSESSILSLLFLS